MQSKTQPSPLQDFSDALISLLAAHHLRLALVYAPILVQLPCVFQNLLNPLTAPINPLGRGHRTS